MNLKKNNIFHLLLALLLVFPIISTPLSAIFKDKWKILLVNIIGFLLITIVAFFVFFLYNSRLKDGVLILVKRPDVYFGVLLVSIYVILSGYHYTGLATVVGLALGVRFIIAYELFCLVAIVLNDKDLQLVVSFLIRFMILVGFIVSFFGVLQVTVLPQDLLVNIGYEESNRIGSGIPSSMHYVLFNDTLLPRAQSLLRGPNAFGTFLLIPWSICLYKIIYILRMNIKKHRPVYVFVFLIISLGILLSLSRSAWIGMFAIITILALTNRNNIRKIVGKHKFLSLSMLMVCIFSILPFMSTSSINIFTHNNSAGTENSNDARIRLMKQALISVTANPFGTGAGSAGPASALSKTEPRITENYFLQVALETGIVGLVLFVFWLFFAIKRIGSRTDDFSNLISILLVGLILTSLFQHTWSDESVAVSFWVIAGLLTGLKTSSERKAG